jgi:hypothetical protein
MLKMPEAGEPRRTVQPETEAKTEEKYPGGPAQAPEEQPNCNR